MLLKPDAVKRRCKEDVQADAKEDGAYGSDSDGDDEHSSPGNSSPDRGRPGPWDTYTVVLDLGYQMRGRVGIYSRSLLP